MTPASETSGSALGLIVPCRNEARVVARKVANLARARWPHASRPHRLVLVDDGSDDGTAERAREALAVHAAALERQGVRAEVVRNDGRPGKPGAIRAGLARVEADRGEGGPGPGPDDGDGDGDGPGDGARCELVVLSDADVCVAPDALVALARAFDAPELALACGAQRFVDALADDGSAAGEDGGPLVDAGAAFDRWTALVRRLESARGRLFSVHGQLLAWRTSLGLAPSPGIAADDLDLMLQVREGAKLDPSRPRRVELVPDAVFLEVKTRPSELAPDLVRDQELRRARAYVQVVRAWDGRPPARGLQWAFYRHVPLAAPAATLALALALPVLGAASFGPAGALGAVALLVLALATPHGRGWLRLARRIHQARRRQRAEPLPERWEMVRR